MKLVNLVSFVAWVNRSPIPGCFFFGEMTGVIVRLLENGECVLFRSLSILDLDEIDAEFRCDLFQAMLKRNDRLAVGHYSASSHIVFEAALPIEDGDVTDEQLGRLLSIVSSEVSNYGPKLRAIARGESDAFRDIVQDDLLSDQTKESIDSLIQRLIDGDEETDSDE